MSHAKVFHKIERRHQLDRLINYCPTVRVFFLIAIMGEVFCGDRHGKLPCYFAGAGVEFDLSGTAANSACLISAPTEASNSVHRRGLFFVASVSLFVFVVTRDAIKLLVTWFIL